MFRDFLVLLAFLAAGIVYLASTGEDPNTVKLPLQIGITIVAGGVFLFFERFINKLLGVNEKETVDEIRALRQEIAELTAQVEMLRDDILVAKGGK